MGPPAEKFGPANNFFFSSPGSTTTRVFRIEFEPDTRTRSGERGWGGNVHAAPVLSAEVVEQGLLRGPG